MNPVQNFITRGWPFSGPLRVPNLRSFCFKLTGKICLGNLFFISKTYWAYRIFFSEIFYIDGWMDGWKDGMGWVGFIFFGFVYFSKTTSYIILIVSGPLRRHFQVSFVKKRKKIKKINFVKNFAHLGKFLDFWRFSKKIQGNLIYFDQQWWFTSLERVVF